MFPLSLYTTCTGLRGNVATSISAAAARILCLTPVVLIGYGKIVREVGRFTHADDDGDKKDGETASKEMEEKVERRNKDSSKSTGISLAS